MPQQLRTAEFDRWQDDDVLIVLLCGGDKSTQARDITRAQAMVKELKE
jgi:putative addiction module killer protein